MDFITDLPPSLRRTVAYDAILVMVDRYIKCSRYIPARKDWNAEIMADVCHETASNQKDLGLIRSCPIYPVPPYRTAGSLELPQVHWTYRGFIGPTAGSLDLPQVH